MGTNILKRVLKIAHKYTKTQFEIADIFHAHKNKFLEKYPQPLHNLRIMRLIEICRTSKLGGHLQACEVCDYEKPMYNSCGCRFCPKCQALNKERWIKSRQNELLPVDYFHNVFTIPHELNPLVHYNKKILLDILFSSVSETFQRFAKKEFKGQVGFISVLHTWNQKVLDHFHLHCIIPAGALSQEGKWIKSPNKKYFFSVRAMSKVFKTKFIYKLRKNFNKLKLSNKLGYLNNQDAIADYLDSIWNSRWVVYSKKSFSGPQKVIEYLGRYTHRIAISNYRIKDINENQVTFKYRDRKDGNKLKEMTIDSIEFIRRYMLHILPKSFMRIRYHGFLANKYKNNNIEKILKTFDLKRISKTVAALTVREFMLKALNIDISICPKCKIGKMYKAPLVTCRSP